MAKKRIFDLPQTKGEFQIRGNASGVLKNNFFTSKKTKNNTDMPPANSTKPLIPSLYNTKIRAVYARAEPVSFCAITNRIGMNMINSALNRLFRDVSRKL